VKLLVERQRQIIYFIVGTFNFRFIRVITCWYLSWSLSVGLGNVAWEMCYVVSFGLSLFNNVFYILDIYIVIYTLYWYQLCTSISWRKSTPKARRQSTYTKKATRSTSGEVYDKDIPYCPSRSRQAALESIFRRLPWETRGLKIVNILVIFASPITYDMR